jgi:hypothetical protein
MPGSTRPDYLSAGRDHVRVRFVVPEPRIPVRACAVVGVAGVGDDPRLFTVSRALDDSPLVRPGTCWPECGQCSRRLGAVPKALIWDRESAIGGGTGRVSVRRVRQERWGLIIQLAPAGIGVQRPCRTYSGFLEPRFLPAGHSTSPADFNMALDGWLLRANSRLIRPRRDQSTRCGR